MMIPVLGSLGIPGSKLFPVPKAPYDTFPYIFLLYLVVTCGWFNIKRWRSPNLIVGMRQEIEKIHARFNDRKFP